MTYSSRSGQLKGEESTTVQYAAPVLDPRFKWDFIYVGQMELTWQFVDVNFKGKCEMIWAYIQIDFPTSHNFWNWLSLLCKIW